MLATLQEARRRRKMDIVFIGEEYVMSINDDLLNRGCDSIYLLQKFE